MPHFENIDQYESPGSKSGRKKIIPIAPHSMQAVDYRPAKRPGSGTGERDPEPEFKEVEIQPTSIKQMEKEFKQAARAEARRNPRKGAKSWLSRLKAFIAGIFGKEPPGRRKGREKTARGGRSANRDHRARDNDSRKPRGGRGQSRSSGSRNRSRNRRPRNRGEGGPQAGGNRQGGDGDRHPDKRTGDGKSTPSKSASNRRRRSRRPGGKPSQQNRKGGPPPKND